MMLISSGPTTRTAAVLLTVVYLLMMISLNDSFGRYVFRSKGVTINLKYDSSESKISNRYHFTLHPSFLLNRSACLENLINRVFIMDPQFSKPGASPTEYSKANKELRKIRGSMKLINELRTKQKEIDGLKSLMAECPEDKDLLDMATGELNQAVEGEKKITDSIENSECSKLSAGVSRLLAFVECEVVISLAVKSSCIAKVVFGFCLSGLLSLSYGKGTGGKDASLSAMDIFKMYERYSHKKGWKSDVTDVTESDLRGDTRYVFHPANFHVSLFIRWEASAAISGAGVYGKLKFESGIHRVQRVPVREKSGRVHTSAVSVTILPQADEVDVQLRNEDLRIGTYRSGGPGGQHANNTNSAVRITHIPTGMTVSIQDERSQHMNKAKALKLLCAKLCEMERTMKRSYHCKLTVSGDRSELIRTYNFP
ncbi:hypothetical protein Pint_16718 [Pistacia integerrima]|uniref:Uncharacterized protein n=1 Tax=Pistacia integerrima TaxID=434235 RepID=A0ACC0ZGI9_9ROSI|nr:hypothetical protein Pint_16718 [Pistacia integerrima]